MLPDSAVLDPVAAATAALRQWRAGALAAPAPFGARRPSAPATPAEPWMSEARAIRQLAEFLGRRRPDLRRGLERLRRRLEVRTAPPPRTAGAWRDEELDALAEAARQGLRAPAIARVLAARGCTRSVWAVRRALRRLRERGGAVRGQAPPTPARPTPAPRRSARQWVEPDDKAAREAEVARELRRAADGLPREGVAVTLPGWRLDRAVAALAPLAPTIVAVERDPAIHARVLATPWPRHPLRPRVRYVLGEFWAVVRALEDPIRVLDYDGMAAMRPDVLAALLDALPRLTPEAVVRLTFETAMGARPEDVLAALAAHATIPFCSVHHHARVRPMATLVLRLVRRDAPAAQRAAMEDTPCPPNPA